MRVGTRGNTEIGVGRVLSDVLFKLVATNLEGRPAHIHNACTAFVTATQRVVLVFNLRLLGREPARARQSAPAERSARHFRRVLRLRDPRLPEVLQPRMAKFQPVNAKRVNANKRHRDKVKHVKASAIKRPGAAVLSVRAVNVKKVRQRARRELFTQRHEAAKAAREAEEHTVSVSAKGAMRVEG
jgi:hypothetical protein